MKGTSVRHGESLVEANSFSAVDLFRDVQPSQLRRLKEKSEVREYNPGHIFFRPGEQGEALFLLEKGRVQTFRTTGTKKLIIAELRPPAVFGEMACVGQHMYHCSAQATTHSRIRYLSRTNMDAVLQQYPEVTRRLLDLVGERFVQLLLNLEETSFRPLIPRLAKLLLSNAENNLVRDLTHKQIAERLHVYRESATSALGELRKAGIVAIQRKCIRITDLARLERASRE